MFGGKLYVAVLSLALTPIIARLFSPEDYGAYGLYNSVVQNLVVVGTFSLPLAISTIKKGKLNDILNLTLSMVLVFTLLYGVLLYFFNQSLDVVFSTHIFSSYWLIVLLGFTLTSITTSLHAVNIRLQRFKNNTQVGVMEGSSTKGFNLLGGWYGLNSIGLILSDVGSKLISLFLLLRNIPKEVSFSLISISKLKSLLHQLKHFSTFVMPSQWIGIINNQFIIIVVALLFSKNDLGQLVMAIGLLGIPLHVLTNAFQPVITERLSSLDGKLEIKTFFKHTSLLLFLIAFVLFTSILLLPAEAITFLLGDKWSGIKPIINVIALYYIILLIDQSFENGFIILKKEKAIFYISLLELVILLSLIAVSSIQELPLMQEITLIAMARSLVSILRVMYLWQKIKSSIIEL